MEKFRLEQPIIAVDVVIFGIQNRSLMVLLHKRNKEPFKDAPALPGTAVRLEESLENAAQRALAEKTKWTNKNIFLDQLAAFDSLYRDPRGRTISVAYMGITQINAQDNKKFWKPVKQIAQGTLPFDHNFIIDTAVQRLSGKLRYTNIAKGFLPETFRIEHLQEIYEAILDRSLNRSNFRNKLLKINMIKQVTSLTDAVGKKGGRPPHLYRFTQGLIKSVDRDFL